MKQQQLLEDIKIEVSTGTKEEAAANSYKISKLTVRLHIIFAMQAFVHSIGLIGASLFSPNGPYNRVFTYFAFVFGVGGIAFGKIALERRHVSFLSFYLSISEIARSFSVVSTGRIIMKTYVSEEMQKTAGIFFYAHLLLGVGVEVFQIFTIGALLKTISPPRN